MMKIHVNRVPTEGMQEHASYNPATMDMDREDIRVTPPVEVDAWVQVAQQELIVRAAIACHLQLTCARCLEEFDTTAQTETVFSYSVKPTDVVDITNDVRQEIILGYPMVPLCRTNCRGLCVTCGQNLNRGSCPHHAGTV